MKRLSFNDEMMRAWLEGRKTVTRRLMKPQPYINEVGQWLWKWNKIRKEVAFWPDIKNYGVLSKLSPYSPSETVFIAETWACVADGPLAVVPMIAYKDGTTKRVETFPDGTIVYNFNKPDIWRWRSPVTMPEWASRSKAIIKSVEPEQVEDEWYWKIELEKKK